MKKLFILALVCTLLASCNKNIPANENAAIRYRRHYCGIRQFSSF